MKKIGFLPVFIAIVGSISFTITEDVCKAYFPSRVGTTLEYTMYNDKNKVSGRMVQQVKSMNNIPNGEEVEMAMDMYDEKDKPTSSGQYKLRCEGDKYYVDMSNLMSPETRATSKDMTMEMESSYLEYPTNPKPGQTLPNGKMDVKMKMEETTVMNMTFLVTDRKVEGFEDVTTPAGTFKCVKYTDRTEIKALLNIKSRNTNWVAEDIGTVKTESYNDKGKMISSMVLTKYQKK